MKIGRLVIVFRDNHYGLTRDAQILRDGIASIGLDTILVDKRTRGFLNSLRRRPVADTIIHLERIHPRWLSAAENHILIPNQERFPARHLGKLRNVDLVLTKTLHAKEIFCKHDIHCEYLGFTSADRYDRSISKDWHCFFHLAGGNTLKGTEDILALWRMHPEWPTLVLVQKQKNAPRVVPPNIILHSGYIDDHELKRLQNSCGIHLCPSQSEGWGHSIVEGMSCGVTLVTTDAPPMNEHVTSNCGVVVQSERFESRHLGRRYFVERGVLEAAITRLLAEPLSSLQLRGINARRRFEQINRSFVSRLQAVFEQCSRTGGVK